MGLLLDDKVSSTNLNQCLGVEPVLRAFFFKILHVQVMRAFFFKILHVQVTHYGADWGPHSHALKPVHRNYFEKKSMFYADRTLIVQLCSVLIIQFCTTV